MKILAVSDTCIFVSLYKSGCLFILNKLFDKIIIQNEIKNELSKWIDVSKIFSELSSYEVVKEKNLIYAKSKRIHLGEIECISYAVNNKVKYFLSDDELAIREAIKYGLTPIRCLDLLKTSKFMGYIESVSKIINTLELAGEGIKKESKLKILRDVGEI